MPAFADDHDEPARGILAQCFPGRDIMQIDALDIVQGGGGMMKLHYPGTRPPTRRGGFDVDPAGK